MADEIPLEDVVGTALQPPAVKVGEGNDVIVAAGAGAER
jgi:hypothetical protein